MNQLSNAGHFSHMVKMVPIGSGAQRLKEYKEAYV